MRSESTRSVTPVHNPNGVRSVQKLPVNWCALLMGRPLQQIAEGDPHEQGDQRTPDRQSPPPGRAPTRVVELALVLEGEAPHHEGDQQDHERQIEGREHGGVPAREGGEYDGAGDDSHTSFPSHTARSC